MLRKKLQRVRRSDFMEPLEERWLYSALVMETNEVIYVRGENVSVMINGPVIDVKADALTYHFNDPAIKGMVVTSEHPDAVGANITLTATNTLIGLRGTIYINGGNGYDSIFANTDYGVDIHGGPGNDTIIARGGGQDLVYGGPDSDMIILNTQYFSEGQIGEPYANGGAGNDILYSRGNQDHNLEGGGGIDYFYGSADTTSTGITYVYVNGQASDVNTIIGRGGPIIVGYATPIVPTWVWQGSSPYDEIDMTQQTVDDGYPNLQVIGDIPIVILDQI